jgi:hypothetical protein
METRPIEPGLVLSAMIGILVVAMLDRYGVISTEGPVSASVFYGIGGVGGGVVAYPGARHPAALGHSM